MSLTIFDGDEGAPEPISEPDLPIIDAHHHLWAAGDPFPYYIEHFRSDLASGHNILGTVFVECLAQYHRDGEEALRPVGETTFIQSACPPGPPETGTAVAAGIVGWADLTQPRLAARTMDAHIEAGKDRFKGVRHNVGWHADTSLIGPRRCPPHLLLDNAFRAGLAEVARRGLSYDVWLFHRQLAELAATADVLPNLTFVLNHFGGPATSDATPSGRQMIFDDWRTALFAVAERPNIYLKLGGVGMPCYGFDYSTRRPDSIALAAALQPYIDTAIEAFGPQRCMFESNFPVDKQGISYPVLWNAFKAATREFTASERHSLFFETARHVYRIRQL